MKRTNLALFGTSFLVGILAISLVNANNQYTELEENTIQAYGHFTLNKYNSEGVLVQTYQSPNLVVDIGLDTMADLVFDDLNLNGDATDATFSFLEIGTGTTSPTATDTTIETSACARGEDTAVTGTSAVSGEITATIDFAFDGGTCAGAITEAGVFNASTVESMLARSTFSAINIGAGDTLTVTYDIIFT